MDYIINDQLTLHAVITIVLLTSASRLRPIGRDIPYPVPHLHYHHLSTYALPLVNHSVTESGFQRTLPLSLKSLKDLARPNYNNTVSTVWYWASLQGGL